MLIEAVKDAFGAVQDTIDLQSAKMNIEEISTVSSISGGTGVPHSMQN